MGEWVGVIGAILTGIIAYLGGVAVSRANATAVNVKTFQDLVTKVQALSYDLIAAEKKIAELEDRIRDDLKETEDLRQKMVEVEEKYNRMRRINEKLVDALNKAGIPMPDLNGDLTDSVRGLKWKGKK